MLVDKEGKIAFKGHPANRPNLEDDINKLIAGEKLTGEGCVPAADKEGDAEEDKDFTEETPEKNKEIMKQMDDFTEIGTTINN